MAKETGIVERVQKTIDRVRAFGEGKDEGYGTATAVIRDAREALADARSRALSIRPESTITGAGAKGTTCLRCEGGRPSSETGRGQMFRIYHARHRH